MSSYDTADQFVDRDLVLRRDPNQEVYTQTRLLSADAYPTAISVYFGQTGKVIYVGTYGLGLYASEGSVGWRYMGLENSVVTRVLIGDSNPDELLAATNLGVMSTQDGGYTWELKGPVNDLVTTLERDPSNSKVLLAGTTHGVFRSADGGDTWIGPSLVEETVTSIAFSPSDPRVVYLSCLFGAAYRSDNEGQNWYRVRPSHGVGSAPIAVDPHNSNLVYIGPADYGLYCSSDGGSTWDYLGLNGVSISAILPSSVVEGAIFVGTDDEKGMYASWDDGQTWENPGVLRDNVISMIEDPSELGVILAATARNGLLRTRDGGKSWVGMGLDRPTFGLDFYIASLVAAPDNPDHLYAIPSDRPGLFESTDGGASWSPVVGLADLMGVQLAAITINPNSPREIYVSGFGGVKCTP